MHPGKWLKSQTSMGTGPTPCGANTNASLEEWTMNGFADHDSLLVDPVFVDELVDE